MMRHTGPEQPRACDNREAAGVLPAAFKRYIYGFPRYFCMQMTKIPAGAADEDACI